MDHAEARERLEVAAAEPGGFDRLMAGDTPDAAALAGHLAGCPECTDEMTRLRRAASIIAPVVRGTPPPELRDRTLAYVAALGRPRGETTQGTTAATEVPAAPAEARPSPGRRFRGRPAAWLAAAAAVLVLTVGAGAWAVGQRDAQIAQQTRSVDALERVTAWSTRITGREDAQRVELAGTGAGAPSGTLLFSPATTELVVVTSGLSRPTDGKEFRCWVEVDGERRSVGRMFFANELAFWVGEVEDVADLPDGARFGVTLVDAGGTSLDGDPTVAGEL